MLLWAGDPSTRGLLIRSTESCQGVGNFIPSLNFRLPGCDGHFRGLRVAESKEVCELFGVKLPDELLAVIADGLQG